jgi:uncharacterized protein GlcG (DUF336 family)
MKIVGAPLVSDSSAVRDGIALRPRMVCLGGAAAVSGGSEIEDENCARAGLNAVGLDI